MVLQRQQQRPESMRGWFHPLFGHWDGEQRLFLEGRPRWKFHWLQGVPTLLRQCQLGFWPREWQCRGFLRFGPCMS